MEKLEWTPERVVRLTEMHGNFTTAEIAHELCITKNAVVGKSHRIGLCNPENNPIGRMPAKKVLELIEMWYAGENLVSIAEAAGMGSTESVIKFAKRKNLDPRGHFLPKTQPVKHIDPASTGNKDGCQWLDGDPIERNFCGKKKVPGYPYCEHHKERCYIKIVKKPAKPAAHYESSQKPDW